MTMTIGNLRGIRGLLADMDGVWFVGGQPIPGATEALARLRSCGIPLRIVTNTTTRTAAELCARMDAMGFDVEPREFVTTPHAAARYLRARGVRTVRLVVADTIRSEFAEFTEASSPDAIVIGDIGRTWTYDLMSELFHLVMNGAEMVALHRGRYWQEADGLRLDIGAFVAGLEYATGQSATVIGKPSAEMFQTALDDLGLAADDVVMIGDDIHQDVAGAQASGIRGILVRTGKFRAALAAASGVVPDHVLASVADLTCTPAP